MVVELFSQNFYRLLLAKQPEYRFLHHIDIATHGYFLLSEYQMGFGVIPPKMGHKFEDGSFKGLGQIVLIAMFLEETDLKNGNIGILPQTDGTSLLVKLDGDYALASFRSYRQTPEELISSEKIDLLPFPQRCKSYNWLDLIKEYIAYVDSNIINHGLNHHPLIRDEINEAILKLVILTPEILNRFIDVTINPSLGYNHEALSNYISKRQRLLLEAALKNTSFLSYLASEKASQMVADFNQYLQTFVQEKVAVFTFMIDLTPRLLNLRLVSKVYINATHNESLKNSQFDTYLSLQLSTGLHQNFEPDLFIGAIEHYASWHHKFKECVHDFAPKFSIELMKALYDSPGKDCLLNSPIYYFEKMIKTQTTRYIENLMYRGDSVASELQTRFDKFESILELIQIYADVLHVFKQTKNFERLIEIKFNSLDCSIEEVSTCMTFLMHVYFQSSLDFRKSLTDNEIFAHYIKLLISKVITEIKEFEGQAVYDEIMLNINRDGESSPETDLSNLNDLMDYKSKLSTPVVARLKRQLSFPHNKAMQLNYESLNISERMELFDIIDEEGIESFMNGNQTLSRSTIA